MMDVSAYRRLQHRMEGRGRTASSHASGHRCACVPDKKQNSNVTHANAYADTNPTCAKAASASSSGPLWSPSSHAWLLQRIQGVEVDITAGDTDHRKRVTCCCACCSGYHHLSHDSRGTESANDISFPSAATAPQQPEKTQQATGAPHHSNAEGSPSSSPVLGAMGQMLSAFLRRAESVPDRKPTASFAPNAFSPRGQCTGSATPRPATCDSHPIPAGITVRRRAHSLSSIWHPPEEPSVPVKNVTQAPPSFASLRGNLLPSFLRKAQSVADAQAPALQTDSSAMMMMMMPTTEPPPALPPPISPQTLRAEPMAAPIEPPQPPHAGTEAKPAPIGPPPTPAPSPAPAQQTESAPAGSADTVATPTNKVTEPQPMGQPLTSNAEAPKVPGTDDLTSVEVMNALRERLLLEKADAYVCGLERQQQQDIEWGRQRGDILALLARLQHEDHEMLEALCESVNSRESDGPAVLQVEVQDAVESEVEPAPKRGCKVEKEVPASSFPKEIIEAYGTGEVKTSKVPRVSSVTVQTEPQPEENVFSPQTLKTAADSTELQVPLPLPLPPPNVHASVPSPSIAKAQLHTERYVVNQAQAPVLEISQPGAGFASGDIATGNDSMQAWVESNFGTSLDPRHRALLQHVLLSREAELQRAAAAEAQCKTLDEKLSAKSGPAAQEVSVSSHVPPPPQSSAPSQAPCMEKLPVKNSASKEQDGVDHANVISLLRTHDKEMAALQAMQREHDTRLQELTHAYQNISSQQQEQSHRPVTKNSTLRGSEDKLQREALEQQQNTQRLADLQAYVEQLRNGAQQASMAAASQTPEITTVQLSAVDSSGATCCPQTAASAFSSASTARPPAETALAPRETTRSSVAALAGNDGSRAAALQQLRGELDAECARFAEETQRWQSYVKSQEQAHPGKASTLLR